MGPNGEFRVSDIEEIINNHRDNGHNGSLMAVLEEIQAQYRYLPRDAMILVSEWLGVPLSQTYSVATFYNAFSLVLIGCWSILRRNSISSPARRPRIGSSLWRRSTAWEPAPWVPSLSWTESTQAR